MNWKDRFSGRLLSADEAVRQIRSGETISIAHVGSEPYALVDALARNADALTDVDMHFMLSLRKEEPHIAKGMEKHLRFFGYFLGGRCGCASDFRFRAGCAWLLLHGAGD